MSDTLQHYGIKGMKWGVRRFQPYPKGKRARAKGGKPGKEVGKAKSKRQIRKENREAIRKKNNPKGVSTRQLRKEKVRIAKEEHKKAREDIERSINKELQDLANFAKENGLNQDDGGGGNNPEASREFDRRYRDLESRTYNMERTVNARTSRRLIEEYGDTAVKRINDSNRRRQAVALAAPLAVSLGTATLLTLTQSSLDGGGDVLQHYGVKGMKWGVRRYQPYPKGQRNAGKFLDVNRQAGNRNQNGNKSNKITKDSSFKDHAKASVRSKGREISMARAQREIKNLSTKDAKKVVSRAQLENRLKRLNSTKNVGDSQSHRDYLNRASMSNAELKRKVDRLQLADNMRTEAKNANRELVDMGKKAAAYAAPLAIQYAVKKTLDSGRNFGPGGVEEILSKENLDRASKTAAKFIDDLI